VLFAVELSATDSRLASALQCIEVAQQKVTVVTCSEWCWLYCELFGSCWVLFHFLSL